MSDEKLNGILALLKEPKEEDRKLVFDAFLFAEEIHGDQKRLSGESYVSHLLETSHILAGLHMDATVIAAGLLHDSIEKGGATEEALEKKFGKEIAFLIAGVTKLGRLKYRGSERHAESLRKLFVAMARDIRVLIIKLAERLHNVRTLDHLPSERQTQTAIETLEIYAPLANRLGMGKLKDALEESAFPFAYPDAYLETEAALTQKAEESKKYLEKVYRSVQKELAMNNITNAIVEYRLKQLYSLYKKLQRNDMDISKIHDIYALRIIVPSINDCYHILGIIHGMWTPVPGKIKDYIATPKPNGYQSIHTSVFVGDGEIVEVQIRTNDMHQEAEYGIASHIAYAEAGKPRVGGILSKKLAWVKQLLEWQKNFGNSQDFLENLRMDFFQYRVFTFTPKGDVIELPEHATPIDFAYAIHSEIGDHAFGAKINEKLVSLDTSLQNGDIVKILTKKNSKPSKNWLSFVKTVVAKKHIRAYLESGKSS